MTLIAESRFYTKEKKEKDVKEVKEIKKEETNGKLLQCANQNRLCPDQSMKQKNEQPKKTGPVSHSMYIPEQQYLYPFQPPIHSSEYQNNTPPDM
jgi:hypothetical protein